MKRLPMRKQESEKPIKTSYDFQKIENIGNIKLKIMGILY